MDQELPDFWKVLKRTRFERMSEVTMSVPEIIERSCRCLQALQQLLNSNYAKSFEPKFNFTMTPTGLFTATINGFPDTEDGNSSFTSAACKTVEDAVEDALKKFVIAIERRGAKFNKEAEDLADKRSKALGIVHDIETQLGRLGGFLPEQQALPLSEDSPKNETHKED